MSRPSCRLVAARECRLGDWLEPVVAALAAALADGRVFVDGRRANDALELVRADGVVEVYARRAPAGEVAIVLTHAGLVFAAKPAGIATEPDHSGVGDSLVAQVETRLGVARGELHALSRLDVGVSGIVTLARDAQARELVEGLRARGRFVRRYLAISGGTPEPAAGTWSGAIGRQRDGRRRVGGADAKPATTRYATVARVAPSAAPDLPSVSLLAFAPVTGRTHQLRVHAAAASAALLGDASYGGVTRLRLAGGKVSAVTRPALHALWVELGLAGGPLRVEAPVPEDFVSLWTDLGGTAEDLDRAGDASLEC